MRVKIYAALGLVLAVLVLNALATAQAQPSANASTVALTVTVIGKDVSPVTGLQQGDFTVLENKTQQPIHGFSAPSAAQSGSAAPRAVLVLDELSTKFDTMSFARTKLHKFFKESGGTVLEPTLFVALTENGLVLLHDYTRDANALDTALSHHTTLVAYQLRNNGSIGRIDRINVALACLQQIASSVRGYPADTTIIWIAPGFSTIGQMNFDHGLQVSTYGLIQQIANQLMQAHITIDSIDPRGASATRSYGNLWYKHFSPLPSQVNQATFAPLDLRALVVQSGGNVFYGRDDLDMELAWAYQWANASYILRYTSTNTAPNDALRAIQVNVDRPGVTAYARQGYYGLPNQEPAFVQKTQAQLQIALSSSLPYIGLPVLSNSVQMDPKTHTAHITLNLDGGSLAWQSAPGGALGCHLDVAAAQFSSSGKLMQASSFVQALQAKAGSGVNLRGHTLPVVLDLPIKQDKGRLRLIVRDEATGAIGSADVGDLHHLQ